MLTQCYDFKPYPNLLYDVLSKLTPRDYRRASQVCRHWYAISRMPSLLEKMYIHCFKESPHPNLLKEKGWQKIANRKMSQIKNLQELDCHVFFFDSGNREDSDFRRFKISDQMAILERDSGHHFVVNHLGMTIYEHANGQKVLDAFENQIAVVPTDRLDTLILYDWTIRRGNFHFLPKGFHFVLALGCSFLGKNSMTAFLSQKTENDAYVVKLCHLSWNKEVDIKVKEFYSLTGKDIPSLVRTHSLQYKIISWRHIYFIDNKKIFHADLLSNDTAREIFANPERILEFKYWNNRIYFVHKISNDFKLSAIQVPDSRAQLNVTLHNMGKFWVCEKYLFEYLHRTKQMMVSDLEKMSIVGKWSMAFSNAPKDLSYHVTHVELMQNTFFCLYSGNKTRAKTIRTFNLRSDESDYLDNLLFQGFEYGGYEHMRLKDGRLFVLFPKGEGAIMDLNKTPGILNPSG